MSLINEKYAKEYSILMERFTETTGFPSTTIPDTEYSDETKLEWYAKSLAFWSKERPDIQTRRLEVSNAKKNNCRLRKITVVEMQRANICSVMLADCGKDLRKNYPANFQELVKNRYHELMMPVK